MTSWSFYQLCMGLVYCIILVLYYYITMFVIHVVIKTVSAQFVSCTVLSCSVKSNYCTNWLCIQTFSETGKCLEKPEQIWSILVKAVCFHKWLKEMREQAIISCFFFQIGTINLIKMWYVKFLERSWQDVYVRIWMMLVRKQGCHWKAVEDR